MDNEGTLSFATSKPSVAHSKCKDKGEDVDKDEGVDEDEDKVKDLVKWGSK
jgi:hypothetical protein